MMHPLDDARAKLGRAIEHAQALGKDVGAFIARQGTAPLFDIDFEEDLNAGCLVFRIVKVTDLPPEWQLIAGDALFNFRAALDYSAWQMVMAGSNPNPKGKHLIQYPSQEDPAEWPNTLSLRLPGIRPDHLAVVERHQPYQWTKNAKRHPIALLAHFSREDKHRRIVLVIGKNVQYSLRLKRLVGWTRERAETPSTPMNVVKVGTAYHYLDLVPKGRDEAGHAFTQFWVRRHDEYDRRGRRR